MIHDARQLVYNLDDEPVENLLMPPDNGVVLRIFHEIAQAGGLLAAHCEDRDILSASERSLGHPVQSYDDLLRARPDIAESTSIAVAAEFAHATGCRFHVVHMASEKGLETVTSAQRRGIPVTAETCPQYPTLTAADYERVGPMMKVYPPIRIQSDQDALWQGLNDGSIVSVGSDHTPHGGGEVTRVRDAAGRRRRMRDLRPSHARRALPWQDVGGAVRRGDVDLDDQALRPLPAQGSDPPWQRRRPHHRRSQRHPDSAQRGVGGQATGQPVERLPAHRLAHGGTFLELDEGMRPTGHPAMHVVPAALAVAERVHASGADLLRAILAGYEVTSRLFRAFRLRYPVHPHGHFGAVGTAVAAALLDGADPLAAARIASTTPLLPVWDECFEGATVRNTFTGLAAQSGVRACTLARAGFTGSQRALEVTYGEIAGELVDPDVLTTPLDHDDLGISRNYFTLHSACALTHAAIEAVGEMDVPEAATIHRVRVETVHNNIKLDRQPRPNDLSGRFSLPYAVATAILLRRSDPEAFRFRPEVAQLARKVEVSVASDLEAQWPESSPARVSVEGSDGTVTTEVRNPRGHYLAPITGEELREKFFRLVAAPADADLWWSRLTGLRDVADCATLLGRQGR